MKSPGPVLTISVGVQLSLCCVILDVAGGG